MAGRHRLLCHLTATTVRQCQGGLPGKPQVKHLLIPTFEITLTKLCYYMVKTNIAVGTIVEIPMLTVISVGVL